MELSFIFWSLAGGILPVWRKLILITCLGWKVTSCCSFLFYIFSLAMSMVCAAFALCNFCHWPVSDSANISSTVVDKNGAIQCGRLAALLVPCFRAEGASKKDEKLPTSGLRWWRYYVNSRHSRQRSSTCVCTRHVRMCYVELLKVEGKVQVRWCIDTAL